MDKNLKDDLKADLKDLIVLIRHPSAEMFTGLFSNLEYKLYGSHH